MRFRVIAAEYLVTAELKGVIAKDLGEIVCEFIAPQDADVGYENARSQVVNKTWNLQPHFSRLVRNNVEALVIPLHPGLVLRCRTELAIPGGLQSVVISVGRTSRRKSCERLHIR